MLYAFALRLGLRHIALYESYDYVAVREQHVRIQVACETELVVAETYLVVILRQFWK